MAVTGAWYLAERIMYDVDIDHYPTAPTITHDDAQMAQPARSLTVLVSAAEVVSTQYASELAIVARIADTADPLHFGNFATGSVSGWLVKVIYAVFGLMLTSLVIGGMRMHYLRTQRRDPHLAKWLGITGSASIALSVAALIYTSVVFSDYGNDSTSISPRLGDIASQPSS